MTCVRMQAGAEQGRGRHTTHPVSWRCAVKFEQLKIWYRVGARGFWSVCIFAALSLTGGYSAGFLIGATLALFVGLLGLWRQLGLLVQQVL